MGIKNEEVLIMIKDKFRSIETHFNVIEKEFEKQNAEDFNRSKASISFGKATKLYEDIAYLMGIFDGKPKYEGR